MREVTGVGSNATIDPLTDDLRVSATGADVSAVIPDGESVKVRVTGTGADVRLLGDGEISSLSVSGTGGDVKVSDSLTVSDHSASGTSTRISEEKKVGTSTINQSNGSDAEFTYESDNVTIKASQSSTVRVNGKTIVSDGKRHRRFSSKNDGADYSVGLSSPTIIFDCDARDEAFENEVSSGAVAKLVHKYRIMYDAPCEDTTDCPGCGEQLAGETAIAQVVEEGYAILESYSFGEDRTVESFVCSDCK